jgi:tetratricopeptide (TPR) repeat protein
MSRLLLVLFIAAAAFDSAGPAPRIAQPRPPADFRALFEQYRHGDADAAVIEFARWDVRRVNNEARLPAGVYEAGVNDSTSLAALALLHTEALFKRGLTAADRTDLGENDLHYDRAFRIAVDLLRRANAEGDSSLRAFCRSWYIINVYVWTARRSFQRADGLVRTGKKAFGDDAQFLLAAGAFAEAKMVRRAGEAPDVSVVYRAITTSHGAFGPERVDAEAYLRRALAVDPTLFEARLRLGHVLYQLDQRAEARRELERALADARNARHDLAAYMAALFLGQLDQEAGRVDAARASYELAISIYPNGQPAYLALGHLVVASGRPDEGWAIARRVFGDGASRTNRDLRPWNWYRDITASELETWLLRMRTQVRR